MSDVALDGAFGVDCTNGVVTVVRAANRERITAYLTNASDTDMWVGLGKDPVATAGSQTGLLLKANGGALVIDNWLGDIRVAHAAGASKRITGAAI